MLQWFHKLPKPLRLVIPAALSALTVLAVGVFVESLWPVPAQQEAGNVGRDRAAIEQVEGLPAGSSNGNSIPPNPSPGSPTANSSPSVVPPVSSRPTDQPSTASDADLDGYAEPYDDAISAEFNHLSYDDLENSGKLASVGLFQREGYEREEFLHVDAARAFEAMRASASASGIDLIPISGYRTYARQAELFDAQVEKRGSEAAAAELSAPPGHSEHHTGYAIDIGDANFPNADITYDFEQTPAYQWLINNARAFGFELSFPPNNSQGVSFEPWHWRFIGTPEAQETFIYARSAFPAP